MKSVQLDIYGDKMFWMPIFNQPNAAVDWIFEILSDF